MERTDMVRVVAASAAHDLGNLLCIMGFASSLAAILISFVPPSQFGEGSPVLFVAIVGGGILLLGVIVPFLLVRLRKPSWQVSPPPAPQEEAS